MTGRASSARPTAILVSPGSVDGYPPVQAQAQLLADAQFNVELVTTRFPHAASKGVRFEYPGVNVTVANDGGRFGGPGRMAAFIGALAQVRVRARRRSSRIVEIAYDPTGMLYSDYAPFRPRFRIAHFHELLDDHHAFWRERRLTAAISGFDRVVVPDYERAKLLSARLRLSRDPIVVPNYPIKDSFAPNTAHRSTDSFEVIYSGSIGYQQKVDFIGKSVSLWPPNAQLTVIGPTDRPTARKIQQELAAENLENRVRFEDWLDFSALPARLSSAQLGISLLTPSLDLWQFSLGASNKRYLYMKAGLAQVGDMNPGVTELIEGRAIGRCLRAFDPDELAVIIASYASNPDLARSQGQYAFNLYRQEFNYNSAFMPLLREIELLTRSSANEQPAP